MASFQQFRNVLLSHSDSQIRFDSSLQGKLRLAQSGRLTVNYAPFDYIEGNARVVIVGITPGLQQTQNALCEARRILATGRSDDDAIKAAKIFASFSGPMRTHLVAMLDYIGAASALGIETTADLWDGRNDLVHFTSALRYPVYLDGKNYSGTPLMSREPMLVKMLETYLAEEASSLPDALWVPLGPAATEGVEWIVQNGYLRRDRVLIGLPHPSGANAERIAYFLQKKPRNKLSRKTSAEKIDAARTSLLAQMASMGRL